MDLPSNLSDLPSSPSLTLKPQRPTICAQCQRTEFKYTCPACSIRTCSLACSNQHKFERRCSGKRNRVERVQLNEYSWGNLMQDYTYLEEIHRLVSSSRNSRPPANLNANLSNLKNCSTRNPSSTRDFLIRKAAVEGVELILMPQGMSRRMTNMTNYNQKKKCLQWSIEFAFNGGEERDENQATGQNDQSSKPSTHLIHHIPSDTKLIEVLKRTLNLKKLKLLAKNKLMFSMLLDEQQSTEDEDHLVFVLPIESFYQPNKPPSTGSPQFEVHVLQPNSTVSEALSGTKIVEWPRIEVWPAADWTARVSSGRVRILAKADPPRGGCFHNQPVDSGWPAKRKRTENSIHSATMPESNSPVSEETQAALEDENIEKEEKEILKALILDPAPNPYPLINSLLPYSSSEDDSS